MRKIIFVFVFFGCLLPMVAKVYPLDYANATRVELLTELLDTKKELVEAKQTNIELRKRVLTLNSYINLLLPTLNNSYYSIGILNHENNRLTQLSDELLSMPFQPFDISISIQLSCGTGLGLSAIGKLYLYQGLYLSLGGSAYYSWVDFGEYDGVMGIFGDVGIGYDFYWRW